MQEESLIRMNPPCASTDLVRGPTTNDAYNGWRTWVVGETSSRAGEATGESGGAPTAVW